MGRIIGRIMITLCCTILLAAHSHATTAKKVYLKDGGIIECQNVWQANGRVMVLVNRDTIVDLSSGEVDLKKTFVKKAVKRVKKPSPRVVKKKAVPEVAQTGTADKQVAAPTTPGKGEAAPKPGKKPITAAAKPPAPQPAKPAADKGKPSPAAKIAGGSEKPAAPAATPPAKPVRPAVQKAVSSATAPAPEPAAGQAEPPRSNLPLAKPASPPTPPEKSFLSGNMTNLALGALVILLIIGYVVYKKKQNG